MTYEELRRLACIIRRHDLNATLNPTELVNEAWLKLAGSPGFATTSRLHFKRVAARAMRQVLVEAARRRISTKRGGGDVTIVDVGNCMDGPSSRGADLMALEDVLQELERVAPRQAQLVESRFFGGLDMAEAAALLEVSEATAHREWRAVKAWLKHRLRHTR